MPGPQDINRLLPIVVYSGPRADTRHLPCHKFSVYSENLNAIPVEQEQMFGPINAAPVSGHKCHLSKTERLQGRSGELP